MRKLKCEEIVQQLNSVHSYCISFTNLIQSPTCGRGRNNNWVYAHWYEEGSWSGKSSGIEPDGSPLTVQGQTRFLVDNDLKITEIVIARTFSRWEEEMLLLSTKKDDQAKEE